MRVASLDLGSNTFLCLIADVDDEGKISIQKDIVEVVRLGQGLAESNRLCEEALERARLCLERFSQEIKKYSPDRILAVATAAARKASNGDQLIMIGESLGIPIKVISGDLEGKITYRGALTGANLLQKTLVIDIGGGSTELIVGAAGNITYKKSFEIGVVKLKEKFVTDFPISASVQKEIEHEILNSFSGFQQNTTQDLSSVVAVAGTPTTLAAAALGGFDPEKIQGYTFNLEELENWRSRLLAMTPEQIEANYTIPKGRSDVIGVGVMILIGVLGVIGKNQITVSTRGLRFGLARLLAAEEEIND
ncbi:MAG: hypothetical protein RJB66_2325 [Pseudomonadota bacterium]|jgi:exopolyphosphatase/guanosine-5'-triphosphate,3'-diphosphate pyrophosphatase